MKNAAAILVASGVATVLVGLTTSAITELVAIIKG